MDKLLLRTIIRKFMENDDADKYIDDLMQFESELTTDIIRMWPENIDITFAANHILMNASLLNNPRVDGSWIANDGNQYAIDLHRIIKIKNPIENLLKLPKQESPVDAKNMMDKSNADVVIDIPSIKDLKEMVQECISSHSGKINRFIYIFDCGLELNVEYLLSAITATGATQLRTSYDEKQRFRNLVFLESEEAEMMILPLYSSKPAQNTGKVIADY